jgi:hypothetical protein
MNQNENTQPVPGARKDFPVASKTQDSRTGKNGYEDRRNAAACFENPNKHEDWQPDYVGVTVADGLETGQKIWVNVFPRTSSKGQRYYTVILKPWKRPEH